MTITYIVGFILLAAYLIGGGVFVWALCVAADDGEDEA